MWLSIKKPSESSEWVCPVGEIMLVVYESGWSIDEIYYNGRVLRWDCKLFMWQMDLNAQPNNNKVQLKNYKAAQQRIEEWYLSEYVVDKIITDQE